MAGLTNDVEHLLRRAGFGVGPQERLDFHGLSYEQAVDRLVDYEAIPDDVDSKMQDPAYLEIVPGGTFNDAGVLVDGPFDPNRNLVDAMERWVFRMVHSRRPLQEKMTLFWHNHFATGRSKIIETFSFPGALRAFATKQSEDPDGARGQIEMFRDLALADFGVLLLEVARDPAMVAWLDGNTNIVGRPQENFIRELMELFTIGPENFRESDVYAGARVFTGWNLMPIIPGSFDVHYRGFKYYPQYHDTGFKTFSFPIYPDGTTTIPAREPVAGEQDGVELLRALANHPAAGAFLARKIYACFVDEGSPPDPALISQLAGVYRTSNRSMREVMRALFKSEAFRSPRTHWTRYSWPAEYVVRALKEVGWVSMGANQVVFSMAGMGQSLFDPPSVGGWRLGRAWFSTTTTLARMNFAMALCWSQAEALAQSLVDDAATPEALVASVLDRLTFKPLDPAQRALLVSYVEAEEPWSGRADQIRSKAAGLIRLVLGLGEYQMI